MSRTYHHGKKRNIKIRVHAIRRDKPDFKRLSRALIELAEAECEHRKRASSQKDKGGKS